MSEVIVDIPQGRLRGKKDKSVFGTHFFCFHRIPYAKAPVGDLRFKAPQPAEGWSGIRDATEEGTGCPSVDWSKLNVAPGTAEDSLFVNVYCRQEPRGKEVKKFPVMVWIHGGGFELGSGNRDMCGPDYLMENDIVLVTFNYRIGALGFLSLESVACPGNFGLKDQQLALKWVKSNISHFGGDPDNITLFGVSAGAASVHYQTLLPSNEGLFHRAIMQSGSALNRWAFSSRPRANALALARRLGCPATDDHTLLAFLRKAPVEDIVLNSTGLIDETEGPALGEWFLKFTFVPSVEPEHEGAFLTEHPWLLLREGRFLDVPLVTGVTSSEMILGVQHAEDYPRWKAVEDFQELIPRNMRVEKNSQRALDFARLIKEFYCKDGMDLYTYINILSDTFFNYGVFKIVKSRTTNEKIKSPTYFYEFDYEGDQPFIKDMLNLKDIKGTAHGQDSPYLFRMVFSVVDKMAPGCRDRVFMQRLTKLWTSFATVGVPSLEEPGFSWKEARYPKLEYLKMGEEMLMKEGLLRDRMEFWDRMYSTCFDLKQ